MTDQAVKYAQFAAQHIPGDPVILFNVWDVGSARAVHNAGATALATGSHSVAMSDGYKDGEVVPLDTVVANAARIVAAVTVPVSIDFEAGYGATPDEAAASLAQLLGTGIVGVNIEDGLFGKGIRTQADQVARLAALSSVSTTMWINARTDVFLMSPPEAHADHLSEALERGVAYAEAGAHSFFVPGLVDMDLIARVCDASSLPVNVMATGKTPSVAEYAEAGVGRISYGGYPWHLLMKILTDEAAKLISPS